MGKFEGLRLYDSREHFLAVGINLMCREYMRNIRDEMTARKCYPDDRSQIVGAEVVRQAVVGRPNGPKSAMLN